MRMIRRQGPSTANVAVSAHWARTIPNVTTFGQGFDGPCVVLWLMVVVGLGVALWNERKAGRDERDEKEHLIFWNKTPQRAIEREGFRLGDSDLGYVDLIPTRREESTDNRP